MKRFVPFVAVMAMLVTAQANAQSTGVLVHGKPGQVLIGGASQLGLGGVHTTNRGASSANRFDFSLAPTVSAFVAPHVALGVTGDVAVSRARGKTAWALAVGPQVTAFAPFSTRAGMLPSVALLYGRAKGNDELRVAVKAPVAVHLTQSVSLTVGPEVTQDVWSKNGQDRNTQYGVNVGLVGWI